MMLSVPLTSTWMCSKVHTQWPPFVQAKDSPDCLPEQTREAAPVSEVNICTVVRERTHGTRMMLSGSCVLAPETTVLDAVDGSTA